nr:MAG TPA: hypothetical protein [Caudoviricetes sp.]
MNEYYPLYNHHKSYPIALRAYLINSITHMVYISIFNCYVHLHHQF